MGKLERKLSSSQMIILGFAAVILLGALLLMLPVSSKSGEITPFLDCLLTSTSPDLWFMIRRHIGQCLGRQSLLC